MAGKRRKRRLSPKSNTRPRLDSLATDDLVAGPPSTHVVTTTDTPAVLQATAAVESALIQPAEWFSRQVAADLWLPERDDLRVVMKHRRRRRKRIKRVKHRRRRRTPRRHTKREATEERLRVPESQRIIEPLLTSWIDVTNFCDVERVTPWRTDAMSASAAEGWRVPERLRVVGGLGKDSSHTSKKRSMLRCQKRKQAINSVLKIRLYPTASQRLKLNQMFATNRAVYNKLVARSRDDCKRLGSHGNEDTNEKMTLDLLKEKYRPIATKGTMSTYFRKKRARQRHLQVNSNVFDSAYRDFVKAVDSSRKLFFALIKKDERTTYPVLKFKSRLAISDSIEIGSALIRVVHGGKSVRFFSTFFGFGDDEGIEIREPLPNLVHSIRLQRLRDGKFYIAIPRLGKFRVPQTGRVCAIDPGVRNFATIYDPGGRVFSVKDTHNVLKRRFDIIRTMQSELDLMDNSCKHVHNTTCKRTRLRQRKKAKLAKAGKSTTSAVNDAEAHSTEAKATEAEDSKAKGREANDRTAQYPRKSKEHRQRYRLRRSIRYTNRRVTRMVNDVHHKLASWLATNYSQVILPSFQSSRMVRKFEENSEADGMPATPSDEVAQVAAVGRGRGRKRTICNSTTRTMLAQAHYRFRMLLKYKMKRAGGRLIECTEEYTSKTCSMCGEIKDNLRGCTIYSCSHCGFVHDRDMSAAKNILHMNMQMLG